jgi:hypothetical protein
MNIENLIARYPRLYHMAEADSWPSIRKFGLLSTNEVVRRSGLAGKAAAAIRRGHRASKIPVAVAGIGNIVLRDQKPMEPGRLEKALVDGTSTSEWYELINSRVFFWVQEPRLLRLLKARGYGTLEHDVLTLDTAPFLKAYAEKVWLCRMNSGNTWPMPHARGRDDFKRIPDYAANSRGNPKKEVVELTVDDQVVDIAKYVINVRRMQGATVLRQLPLK